MCLAYAIKKFEFWRPRLKEILSFLYPQILSNFIVNFYLSILKFLSVQREWLKSLNFGSLV